jgi:RHS repeat-associated protein
MTVHRFVDIAYDSSGRKVRETNVGGGVTHGVTQYSYDVRNRPVCTAIRMNPAVFGSLPTDACTLGTAGAFGQDRITRNVYDDAGQLAIVQRAYGTALQQNYAAYTYSNNGKRVSVTDAKGNRSAMAYDGLDRQSHFYLPSPTTPGQTSATDYEQYGYDANGNRTSLRKRDGRTILYSYDALNRMTLKDIPNTSSGDAYFGYDLRGLQTSARFGSSSGAGIVNVFDSLGRLSSSTNNLSGVNRTLGYLYDAHSNRTQLTFPDGNYFVYSYDGLDRMTAILENGGTTVASLTYDSQGRRLGLTGAVTSSYGYDSASRLSSLTHDLAGTVQDFNYGFTQYNPANQVVARSLSNDGYAWAGAANVTRSYGVNGLNQYTTAGTLSLSYDANGNLTSDAGVTLEYDVENRLISAAGAKTAALAYDPLGRLHQTSGGSVGTTQFLYDGDALIAEYDGSGVLQRRYVHGSATDEPLLWYETAVVSSATKRSLRTDHQGTVAAVADSAGASLAINRYDEYGIPAATNLGRFAYTGQIVIPEIGMYHYKARTYDPRLGRFLQTDPVGYRDHVNLYLYTRGDPINLADLSGEDSYAVARRLDSWVGSMGYGHAYVVSNAQYIGDPQATVHSFGKMQSGNMGNVSRGNVAEVSKTTAASDATHWKSLRADTKKNISQIDASDALVAAVADAVKENKPYALNPAPAPGRAVRGIGLVPNTEVNSNSAAFAVADKAEQIEQRDPKASLDRQPFDLKLPGDKVTERVVFECTQEMRNMASCDQQ